MRDAAADSVRRVHVSDPVAAERRYDYADAFELRLTGSDLHSPEAWVRAGVGATIQPALSPAVVVSRRIREME